MKWLKLFENFSSKYYRAIGSHIGNDVLFIPEDYYEGVRDDNSPAYKYGSFWTSNIPEICASKYIGGAVLGASSMLKTTNELFVYEIASAPTKDISHWTIGDFTYLQEVRYRSPVKGKFIGKVILSAEYLELFKLFYEYMGYVTSEGMEDYEPKFDKMIEMIESNEFQTLINQIKPAN